MKTILFLFHDTNMTGSSITLFRIIEKLILLNQYNIHISFASKSGPMLDLFKQYDVKIYSFDKHGMGGVFKKLLARILYFIKYPFFIYKLQPDLVYSNTLMNIGEVVLSRCVGVKILVHSHEGTKIIQKYAPLIKFEDYFVSKYITVSNYALKSLERLSNQQDNKCIVYNGINPLNQRIAIFPKTEIIQLSVIATVDRNKSQLIAIKALKDLLPSVSFPIKLNLFGKIADTKYYEELQKYIKSQNLVDCITFHGEVTNQSLMYEQTDILLITSLDETFSLTALEAMNVSVPIIASNVGGLPEVIENNVSGLLFEVGNFQELSKHIRKVIVDDLLRKQFINKGHARIIEKFAIDLTSKRVSTIIDNMINSGF